MLLAVLAPRHRSRPLAIAVAGLLVFVGLFVLRQAGMLEHLELSAYDWQVRSSAARDDEPGRVVLVTVGEQDIRRLGRWPVTDETLAEVLEKLSDHGARAIGLDIYRDVPVPPGHERWLRAVTANPAIVTTMKLSGGPREERVPPAAALEGTAQSAFNNVVVDAGGIVRRALLFADDARRSESAAVEIESSVSLAVRLAALYLAHEGVTFHASASDPAAVALGKVTVVPFESTDGAYVGADAAGYQILIDFRRPPGGFAELTLTEVLSDRLDPALVEGKVVLIGLTAQSVKDYFHTPFSLVDDSVRQMPGIALHARVVEQLLRIALDDAKPIRSWSDWAEAVWILIWSVLGSALAYRSRSMVSFAMLGVAGCLVVFLAARVAFIEGWWIPMLPPALAWLAAAALTTAYLVNEEARQRNLLMNLFSRHVSEELAAQIWEQRDQFLRGHRPASQSLTATVMFTDLHGFTRIAERLGPEGLMDWLNAYLEVMTPLVVGHGGVVLRFIGDAILAVFGVPIARTREEQIRRDARNAVHCAVAMQEAVIRLNHDLDDKGLPRIGMRVGIFTGPMVAGSIGGRTRLEYNVHGDTVNIASRLEGFDKYAFSPDAARPCRILIGSTTLAYLDGEYETQRIGEVGLRGKDHTTEVYRVMGPGTT